MTTTATQGNRRRLVAVALVAGLVVAGCGGGSRGFDIGLRRSALDLAFTDEEKAKELAKREEGPLPPELPVLTPTGTVPPTTRPPAPPPPPPRRPTLPDCPKAPEGARPRDPVSVFVNRPPQQGTYWQRNSGTIDIAGAIPLSFRYPPRTFFELANLRTTQIDDPVNGHTTLYDYDEIVRGLDGSETITTYRISYSANSAVGQGLRTAGRGPGPIGDLTLVRRVTKANGTESVFQPTPPVTIVAFSQGSGTTWVSAGVDRDNNTAMYTSGAIGNREPVDVCGTVYDTYRVESTEIITNSRTGYTQQTNPDAPNVYYVATHLGGLFLRKDIHTTTTVGPTVITLNYTSILESATPGPVEMP